MEDIEISREEAIKRLEEGAPFSELYDSRWEAALALAIKALKDEPVVRCKDCKWCHAGYCEKADDIIPFGFAHHEWENFYCAWGERR